MLLDNRLNYKDKIYIYLDKDTKQIKLEGFICPEYFAIRKLIYAHFGRIWRTIKENSVGKTWFQVKKPKNKLTSPKLCLTNQKLCKKKFHVKFNQFL